MFMCAADARVYGLYLCVCIGDAQQFNEYKLFMLTLC